MNYKRFIWNPKPKLNRCCEFYKKMKFVDLGEKGHIHFNYCPNCGTRLWVKIKNWEE